MSDFSEFFSMIKWLLFGGVVSFVIMRVVISAIKIHDWYDRWKLIKKDKEVENDLKQK